MFTKKELIQKRNMLLLEIENIDEQIEVLDNLEKPYVAAISAYHGGGQTSHKTLEQARKKFDEYKRRKYYRNGIVYGAFMYKYNKDGTKTLIENHPIHYGDFYPHGFERKESR